MSLHTAFGLLTEIAEELRTCSLSQKREQMIRSLFPVCLCHFTVCTKSYTLFLLLSTFIFYSYSCWQFLLYQTFSFRLFLAISSLTLRAFFLPDIGCLSRALSQ